MHPNRSFAWTDRGAMLAFAAEVSFAHLFLAGESGPMVAHVPVLVTEDGNLRFHLARSNALTAALPGARALASLVGEHFYVSPDWYGSADQVPTWNYVSVEAEGPVRPLDRDELARLVDQLSAVHEAKLAPKPVWTSAKMTPGRFDRMLGAIEGFELRIESLRGNRKLGQNKSADERAGMAAALESIGRAEAARLVQAEGCA